MRGLVFSKKVGFVFFCFIFQLFFASFLLDLPGHQCVFHHAKFQPATPSVRQKSHKTILLMLQKSGEKTTVCTYKTLQIMGYFNYQPQLVCKHRSSELNHQTVPSYHPRSQLSLSHRIRCLGTFWRQCGGLATWPVPWTLGSHRFVCSMRTSATKNCGCWKLMLFWTCKKKQKVRKQD